MSIGEQIKKYRKAAGLKQVALEELSGVSGGTISAMELRGSMTSRFLPQLAGAFGLTRIAHINQQVCAVTFDSLRATFSTRVNPFKINGLHHFCQRFSTKVL